MENVGAQLKKEIEARGLYFKHVAKSTGIGYISLIHYLNETRPIPESKLRLVCQTFGIDVKKFGLDESPSYHTQNLKEAAGQ